jgi:hypothetical protein
LHFGKTEIFSQTRLAKLKIEGEVICPAGKSAMPALHSTADPQEENGYVRFVPILLQKSFGGDERNFLGPLMRFVRRYVRDLIAHQKNGHGASYRRQRVLQRRSRPKLGFRKIFGVVRFSTFATLSANVGHSTDSTPCQRWRAAMEALQPRFR